MATTVTIRAKLLVILIGWWTLLSQSASSFDLSLLPRSITIGRRLTTSTRHHETHHTSSFNLSASSSSNNVFWTPQDLTKDNLGFVPIPPSDYIKKYQASPELWPVEFFVIAYRHINNVTQKKTTSSTQLPQQQHEGRKITQILVRKSANGTSKYGVGSGVPGPISTVDRDQLPNLDTLTHQLPRYTQTLLSEFNSVVIEHHLKWGPLVHTLPRPISQSSPPTMHLGKYDFSHVDAMSH